MPIYEFACPRCRKVYSFLSKRVAPSRPARSRPWPPPRRTH